MIHRQDVYRLPTTLLWVLFNNSIFSPFPALLDLPTVCLPSKHSSLPIVFGDKFTALWPFNCKIHQYKPIETGKGNSPPTCFQFPLQPNYDFDACCPVVKQISWHDCHQPCSSITLYNSSTIPQRCPLSPPSPTANPSLFTDCSYPLYMPRLFLPPVIPKDPSRILL